MGSYIKHCSQQHCPCKPLDLSEDPWSSKSISITKFLLLHVFYRLKHVFFFLVLSLIYKVLSSQYDLSLSLFSIYCLPFGKGLSLYEYSRITCCPSSLIYYLLIINITGLFPKLRAVDDILISPYLMYSQGNLFLKLQTEFTRGFYSDMKRNWKLQTILFDYV